MYSTRTRVHARLPNGHPREEKRACRTKVRRQVVRACPARGELNGPRARAGAGRLPRRAHDNPRRLVRVLLSDTTRADFRVRGTREDLRVEVGEEVRVGVGVRVGPVEFKLN